MSAMKRSSISYALLALALALPGIGCSSSSSSPNPDGGADASTLNVAWDWVGIIGTGQSLSVGAYGTPLGPMTVQQPYNNLKLSLGGATVAPPFDPTIVSLQTVPLVEPIRPVTSGYPSAYPNNIYGETPDTAMANQVTAMVMQAASRDYVTIHTVVGESGQGIDVIQKNPINLPSTGTSGRAYDATVFEATAIARLASAAGKSYGIGAVVLTHGETDCCSTSYEAQITRLLSDYNQDLAAITGQTAKFPMFVSQQNSVPADSGSVALSALQVLQASLDHPGDIVCTGPKYQYAYAAADTTHVHLDAAGYDRVGEKYGQVYFERVVLGHDWQPLQPTTIDVSGAVVNVHFHVPVPPLAWDDTLPPPHGTMIPEWAAGRGFEVSAGGVRQMITDVQIVGDDTVAITCGKDVSNLEIVVGYATTAEGGTPTGPQPARWGHLRDSDPFVGAVTAMPQPNYCVAFLMTVN
jgi:hypothetical protein